MRKTPSAMGYARTITAAAAISLLLASCGTGKAEDAGPTDRGSGQSSSGSHPELDALASAAEGEDGIVWYESTPDDQIASTLDAFSESFPGIEVEHVRLVGGVDVASRMIQEAGADAPTADLATATANQAFALNERGLVMDDLNADELAVEAEESLPESYVGYTAASVHVLIYNTDAVDPSEAPSTWEDLLDPKWKGRIGTRGPTDMFAALVAEWGEEKAEQYVRDLAANEPFLYASGFQVSNDVAAGVVDVALVSNHTAEPLIEVDAPIGRVLLDPAPSLGIYTMINAETGSPNAAKLFLAWLLTDEGARAYEASTHRGSPYADTETAELVEEVTIAELPPAKATTYQEALERFNPILAGQGQQVEAEQ